MATRRKTRTGSLLAATLAVATVLSCGRDVSGPRQSGSRYAPSFAIQPVFPPLEQQVVGMSGLVAFDHVRVLLQHADGSVALDTLVRFAPGSDVISLSLTVPLSAAAPAKGEPLALDIDFVNSEDVIVYHGGPVTVLAAPPSANQLPSPVQVALSYTGPGASASRVRITPKTLSVHAGDAFDFKAEALDPRGAPIPGAPIAFFALDQSSAASVSPANGHGQAAVPGRVRVVALLITGLADTATLDIVPDPKRAQSTSPAARLAFTSHPGNTIAGAAMAQAIVVTALDSAGNTASAFEGSITLRLAPSSTGATLGGTPTVVALDGIATFTDVSVDKAGDGYRLIASSGALTQDTSQAFKVVAGLAAGLARTGGDGQTGRVDTALPLPIAVSVTDASGNPVRGVSITWTVSSGGGSVSPGDPHTSDAGVATRTWTLGPAAGAQTVTATAEGIAGPGVTFTATATPGAGVSLSFSVEPSDAVAGVAIKPAIQVRALDANGNHVPQFAGAITIAIVSGPAGSKLGGTTTVVPNGGAAHFSDLSLNKPGTSYQLIATSPGVASAVSAPFTVKAP